MEHTSTIININNKQQEKDSLESNRDVDMEVVYTDINNISTEEIISETEGDRDKEELYKAKCEASKKIATIKRQQAKERRVLQTDGESSVASKASGNFPILEKVLEEKPISFSDAVQGKRVGPMVTRVEIPKTKFRKIRPGPRSKTTVEDALSSSESEIDVESLDTRQTQLKRKRGRPPSTGQYVGFRKAQEEQKRLEQQEEYLFAERSLLEEWTEKASTRSMKVLKDQPVAEKTVAKEAITEEPDKLLPDLSATCIVEEIEKSMQTVRKISSFTKGYKGTSRKILKEVAEVVSNAVKELARRTSSDENKRLVEENCVLRGEITSMRVIIQSFREEIQNLRKEFASPSQALDTPPPAIPEASDPPRLCKEKEGKGNTSSILEEGLASLEASIIRQVGQMLNARFEGIEKRLLPEERLRPPLDCDSKDLQRTPDSKPPSGKKSGGPKGELEIAKKRMEGPKNSIGPKPAKMGVKDSGRDRRTTVKELTNAPASKKQPPSTRECAVVVNSSAVLPAATANNSWVEVVKRKGKRKKEETFNGDNPPSTLSKKGPNPEGSKPKGSGPKEGKGKRDQGVGTKTQPRDKKVKVRPPRRAAILVSMAPPSGEVMDTTDAEGQPSQRRLGDIMAEVRKQVKLTDFGITRLTPKRAANGGVLFEVPGEGNAVRAAQLGATLKALLEPRGVRVTVPVKRAELRVTGLDDSVSSRDVAEAIAEKGGCLAEEVQVSSITKSPRNGLGSCWVRAPATAAKKAVDSGPLTVGWVRVRVEVLTARPLQCYKCMGAGHTRANCKAEVDRSGLCYRCGKPGHKASGCNDQPCCPYCRDMGCKADHRYGGKSCSYSLPKKTKGGKSVPIKGQEKNSKGGEKGGSKKVLPTNGAQVVPRGTAQEEAAERV